MSTIYKENRQDDVNQVNDSFSSNAPKYIPPKRDPQEDLKKMYTEELRRRLEACTRESCTFNLDKHQDAADVLFAQHRQTQIAEYGEHWASESLLRIERVILKDPSSFELDSNGTLLKSLNELEVPEALVYTIWCEIKDGYECSKGRVDTAPNLMAFDSKRGFYSKPVVRHIYNKLGQEIGGEVVGSKTQYFIPYSSDRAKEILNKWTKHPKFEMHIRREGESSQVYSVKSEHIFVNESSGVDIISANQENFFKSGGDHAMDNYRKWTKQVKEAESQGKKVITIDNEVEALIKESGKPLEELVKEHVSKSRTKKNEQKE